METVKISRLIGPILDTPYIKSTFGSGVEHERMTQVRRYISILREAWLSNERYKSLMTMVRGFLEIDKQQPSVRDSLQRLLSRYNDYADVDAKRAHVPEQYDALELYCSDEGYHYLFRLMSQTLRVEDASEELLLTAAIMVELVTIDLYNLRLSQIGDPRYANYSGITYRGMNVSPQALEEYREIINRPDVSKRSFAVPLALLSTSTDHTISKQFGDSNIVMGKIFMSWEIHIHGIDADLLRAYHAKYPDSIVTSICAMPVGRLSEFGEKEILLRGVFFQLIALEEDSSGGTETVKAILVVCNANRDHVSEQASNEGKKKTQREIFSNIAMASKFEVCAKIAEVYSSADAQAYKILQEQKLDAIRNTYGLAVPENEDLAEVRSEDVAVWLGGSFIESYPRHYSNLRLQWQQAVECHDWCTVEALLHQEYNWRRAEWFNVGRLSLNRNQALEEHNFTLLHQLMRFDPGLADDSAAHSAWTRLVDEAATLDIWRSLRANDESKSIAYQLAEVNGLNGLADRLRPQYYHNLPESLLTMLESQLHELMRSKAGKFLEQHYFKMPQVTALLEMHDPCIWIPIPNMYGGFLVMLRNKQLKVTIFETQLGSTWPIRSEIVLEGEL